MSPQAVATPMTLWGGGAFLVMDYPPTQKGNSLNELANLRDKYERSGCRLYRLNTIGTGSMYYPRLVSLTSQGN